MKSICRLEVIPNGCMQQTSSFETFHNRPFQQLLLSDFDVPHTERLEDGQLHRVEAVVKLLDVHKAQLAAINIDTVVGNGSDVDIRFMV